MFYLEECNRENDLTPPFKFTPSLFFLYLLPPYVTLLVLHPSPLSTLPPLSPPLPLHPLFPLSPVVPPPPLRPLLVSSSKDHTVRVWGEEEEGSDGRSSEFICKGVGSGHTEAVGAVAFGRSGFTVHLPASHIASGTRIHCVPEVCKNKESLSTLRCCGTYT